MSNKTEEIEKAISEYQKQEFNITEFEIDVKSKFFEYIKEYDGEPRYLKIPQWIYNVLEINFEKEISENIRGNRVYRGLKICPTISIETIEEIEVF